MAGEKKRNSTSDARLEYLPVQLRILQQQATKNVRSKLFCDTTRKILKKARGHYDLIGVEPRSVTLNIS